MNSIPCLSAFGYYFHGATKREESGKDSVGVKALINSIFNGLRAGTGVDFYAGIRAQIEDILVQTFP